MRVAGAAAGGACGAHLRGVLEDVGEQEVEQRPQLVQVVLQRRAGDQQALLAVEHAYGFAELRVLVLDAVRVVDDQVLPRELLEGRPLGVGGFVRGHDDVPGEF